MPSRLFRSYVDNPRRRQRIRMTRHTPKVRRNPLKPRVLPAPKAPLPGSEN